MSTPFEGDLELAVGSDGALELPSSWVFDDLRLVAFKSPVPNEPCLRVYAAAEWDRTAALMERHGTPLPDIRRVTLEQGRVLRLPPELLAAVGIKDRAIVAGAYSWIEIWSVHLWVLATSGPGTRATFWVMGQRR